MKNLPMSANDPLARLHRHIDDLFSSSWLSRAWSGNGAAAGAVVPSLDVSEDDKMITATAELPGLDEKDVEITLADNVLTIKGEKKFEREEKDEKKNYHLLERSYGSFRRSIGLDADVDAKNVKATFDKGVLKIVMPKLAQPQTKSTKIAISRT